MWVAGGRSLMDVPNATIVSPEATVSSGRILNQQADDDARKKGLAEPKDAKANPGPDVGKVVDISA